MTLRPRVLVIACGLAPAIAAATLSFYRPPALGRLEAGVYDTLLRSARLQRPDARVVIVDIDERSLSAVGQWPWRRDVVGHLIDRLRGLGASIVALDVVFAESDRYEGDRAATDAALADVLRAGRVVLGYALTFDGVAARGSACVQHPLGLAIVRRDEGPEEPFFTATGAICTLPILSAAAGASGFLNAAPDTDGLLRRVPLLLEFDGRVYPSLALASVLAATGARDVALQAATVNALWLRIDGRNVPLDGKSNLLVRYRGPKHTFPYVSAADVLSGAVGSDVLSHALVFVGTTALGTREVVATPLDTLFAGVEVQATVADDLLQADFLRRPEFGVALEAQIALALGILAVALTLWRGLAWASAASLGSLAVIWGGAVWLVSSRGVVVSPLLPTLGLTASIVAMGLARFAVEHRRADRAVRDRTTSQRLMVQSLLSLTEVRDAETGRHSRRTQQYTRVLAQRLSAHPRFREYLTPERVELLASLAPLHDIGKVGVPDRLLNKPGALTPDELVEMRKHPVHGRDVIVHAEQEVGASDDAILALAKDIVYTHHEKWDGTGYPQGLQGTDIPIAGRVMAIVDVYDAILTRRLYHQPMTHADAVAFIASGRGTHFDPAVVDAFLEVSGVLRELSAEGMGAAPTSP
jgi:CHASE2 domain-containing sensor protein